METHFKTIPLDITLSENVENLGNGFCASFADTLQKLVDAASEMDAFCMPMYLQYELIDSQGEVRYISCPEKVGEDFDKTVNVPVLSFMGRVPYFVERKSWRLELDPDKIIPEDLRSEIKTIRVLGRDAVDLSDLPAHTDCQASVVIDGKRYRRLALKPYPGPKNVLIKTVELFDAETDRSLAIDGDLNAGVLSDLADQRPVTENNDIAHLQSAESRELADSAVNTQVCATETKTLCTYSDIMNSLGLPTLDTVANAISRIADKKTLRRIRDIDRCSRRHKYACRTDAVKITSGESLSYVRPETRDFNGRTNDCNPLNTGVWNKPCLTVALLGGVSEVPEPVTENKECFHNECVPESEIQHPQPVIHNGQMGINRCIGNNYPVAHPDAVWRKVPYALDSGCNHCVGNILCTVDWHGNYTYPNIHFLYQLFEPINMVNRYASNFCSDNLLVDIDTGNDVETIALEAGVGDKGSPETS